MLLHAKRAAKLLSCKEWQSVSAITLSPMRLGRGHLKLQKVYARAADAEGWRAQEEKAKKEEKRRWRGIHAGKLTATPAAVRNLLFGSVYPPCLAVRNDYLFAFANRLASTPDPHTQLPAPPSINKLCIGPVSDAPVVVDKSRFVPHHPRVHTNASTVLNAV